MTAAETPDPPAPLAARAPEPAPTAGQHPGVARDPGSYRDPAGFVYRRSGIVYRQVQAAFADDWEHFTGSGLYEQLRREGLLLGHSEGSDPFLYQGDTFPVPIDKDKNTKEPESFHAHRVINQSQVTPAGDDRSNPENNPRDQAFCFYCLEGQGKRSDHEE